MNALSEVTFAAKILSLFHSHFLIIMFLFQVYYVQLKNISYNKTFYFDFICVKPVMMSNPASCPTPSL